MPKNELFQFLDSYFSKNENTIHFFGDKENVLDVMRFFGHIFQSDRPDAYAVIDDEVLIIEHFEFDSSNNRAKGSQQKRLEAEDNRKFTGIAAIEAGTLYHSSINADYTMENYRNNISKIFKEHYGKIEEYKDNLKRAGVIERNSIVRTAFFIEDTTMLGNIYETRSWESPIAPVVLPMCDFFLDLFEASPDLYCVFCGSWIPNDYCLWFIDRSMLAKYRENQIKTNEIKICNLAPRHIGIKIFLPNDAGKECTPNE